MSRNKDYQTMLNSKRWKQLRQWKLQQNPLCQMCQREGKVSAAVDIHHVVPVESAHNLFEMHQLCFNPNNLMAVCIPCHIKIHKDARSHTKEAHKQREEDRMERWKAKHSTKPYGQQADEYLADLERMAEMEEMYYVPPK